MQKANHLDLWGFIIFPSCMHFQDMANINLDHVQARATSMILPLELLGKVGDMQAKMDLD